MIVPTTIMVAPLGKSKIAELIIPNMTIKHAQTMDCERKEANVLASVWLIALGVISKALTNTIPTSLIESTTAREVRM